MSKYEAVIEFGELLVKKFEFRLRWVDYGAYPRTVRKPLLAELEAARACVAFLETFTATCEAAVSAWRDRGAGGQQVPYHGDFASMPPSSLKQMERWAKDARAVLDKTREGR